MIEILKASIGQIKRQLPKETVGFIKNTFESQILDRKIEGIFVGIFCSLLKTKYRSPK